jgi:transcription initiation factor TFIIIB Brf1 subunit/transcription initiation factor TFIIB
MGTVTITQELLLLLLLLSAAAVSPPPHLRLYRLAVEEGFTRGRVVAQVAACCLYIICRQESKPFMLIDLSDLLQVCVDNSV